MSSNRYEKGDRDEHKDLHDRCLKLFTAVNELQAILLQRMQAHSVPTDQLVDIGFYLRQMERLFDDARKEVKAKKELIAKLLCATEVAEAMEGNRGMEPIRGEVAIASPDVKHKPILPATGSPEATALMRRLGITDELALETGAVTFHWTRLTEYLTLKAERGEPLVDGIKSMPEYTCVFRKNTRKRKEKAE